ncbi:MAG: vitamin K epoxide reductase family protein [Mycobacteriales bacterium]
MTMNPGQTRGDEATRAEPGSRLRLAWVYLVGGIIGLAAAFALTLEKIAELRDPEYVPICSLNPVVSCGSVMDSEQAAAFGFPNSLLGMVAFAVVITVGVLMLSGYAPPRWFGIGMQWGTSFGLIFVHWLIYASLYSIHALCPYCLAVWAVIIPIFWYTTVDNLLRTRATQTIGRALESVHTAAIALWFAAIAGLILEAFWSYWVTLI